MGLRLGTLAPCSRNPRSARQTSVLPTARRPESGGGAEEGGVSLSDGPGRRGCGVAVWLGQQCGGSSERGEAAAWTHRFIVLRARSHDPEPHLLQHDLAGRQPSRPTRQRFAVSARADNPADPAGRLSGRSVDRGGACTNCRPARARSMSRLLPHHQRPPCHGTERRELRPWRCDAGRPHLPKLPSCARLARMPRSVLAFWSGSAPAQPRSGRSVAAGPATSDTTSSIRPTRSNVGPTADTISPRAAASATSAVVFRSWFAGPWPEASIAAPAALRVSESSETPTWTQCKFGMFLHRPHPSCVLALRQSLPFPSTQTPSRSMSMILTRASDFVLPPALLYCRTASAADGAAFGQSCRTANSSSAYPFICGLAAWMAFWGGMGRGWRPRRRRRWRLSRLWRTAKLQMLLHVPRVPARLLPAGYRFALLPAPPDLTKLTQGQDVWACAKEHLSTRFAAKCTYRNLLFLIFYNIN